jgi:hypothetical protein
MPSIINQHISKGLRTYALRLIPGDLLEEALASIRKTKAGESKDPAERRKKLVDRFAELGASVDDVKALAGKSLDLLIDSDYERLIGYYTAIKEGDATVESLIEMQKDGVAEEPAPNEKPPEKKGLADAIREKTKKEVS